MHCLFDFLIWLCAVIAFAVYNGSGWGRDMMKATFSFALIMWVFGAGENWQCLFTVAKGLRQSMYMYSCAVLF
jgi:hypothetical protein